MIQSREDLHRYWEADRINLRRDGFHPHAYDEVWRFQRLLRRVEFLNNTGANGLVRKFWSWRFNRQALRCGFEIPLNTFGPGLSIGHRGTIVVHPDARIGANCRIHVDVVIGTRPGPPPEHAPTIGDNCYIGPGAKIYGDVVLGPNLVIGANSVVNKSFPEGNCTIAGAPAKRISSKTSAEYIVSLRGATA